MRLLPLLLLLLTLSDACAATPDGRRKLVLIAGKPSHPPGMHEFRAGTMLLEKCLRNVSGLAVERHESGWVSDDATLADADAVVIYADGGKGHPAVQGNHLETLKKVVDRGGGFGCMHYGVEVEPDLGGAQFKSWIGGHYETLFSCNPLWEPLFTNLPAHPITRGVKPFQVRDEWYFNMRFRPAFKEGVLPAEENGAKFLPILIATPSDEVRNGPYVYPKGPYAHIQAAKGSPEATMWSLERPDGGRGFGFTGGHFHKNWGNEDFRKTILNALLWVTKVEVPEGGVQSTVSEEELGQNLDPKPSPKPKSALLPSALGLSPSRVVGR